MEGHDQVTKLDVMLTMGNGLLLKYTNKVQLQ